MVGTGRARPPGPDEVDEPDRLTSVARLHRCAGLLEHHLLHRLARERTAR